MQELRHYLESFYSRYNRREFVSPDPLELVLQYEDPLDREIVALLAAGLSFGAVRQILRNVRSVLDAIPSPRKDLLDTPPCRFVQILSGWQHRWVTAIDVGSLMAGIRSALERHATLEDCFLKGFSPRHETVIPALSAFVAELRVPNGVLRNYLLTSPEDGSACKRLNLFLRWMVRKDDVDPGGWNRVPASKLIVPLDTHMHKVALELRLTKRRQANLRTSIEITRAFRRISPEDPVKYDFALTRPGIRKERAKER